MSETESEPGKTMRELHDGHLLPATAWPVPEPDDFQWAMKINDYNADADVSWDGERLTTTTEDGTEYYDISGLARHNILRVNSADGPVFFGVNELTDDHIELIELDAETAKHYVEIGAHDTTPDDADGDLHLPDSDADADADDADSDTSTTTSSASNVNRNQHKLSVTRDIGDMNMRGMLAGRAFDENGEPLDDPADAPLTGFQLMYTTGSSLLVPREKLLAKLDDLGLPDWMAPPKVSPYAAFGRMCDDLLGAGGEIDEYTMVSENDEEITVKYDIPKNDGDSRDRTLDVKKYVPDGESGEYEWTDHLEIARFWYDSDTQMLRTQLKDDAKGTVFEEEWEGTFEPTIDHLFSMHQEHHDGRDINTKVMNKLVKQWTDSIRIRDAVYFIPAIYGNIGDHDDTQGLLMAFVELYEWLNENYKSHGKRTRCHAIPIYSTEEERRMVTESVLDELGNQIQGLLDDITDELTDEDFTDELVNEVVDEVDLNEELNEMGTVAERYAQIVDGRLSVEQLINERMNEVEAQQQKKLRRLFEHGDVEIPA